MTTFGFSVEYKETAHADGFKGWEVSLPHQCDRWVITEWEDQAASVARLEAFIAEATAALAALREGRQIEPESDYYWDHAEATG